MTANKKGVIKMLEDNPIIYKAICKIQRVINSYSVVNVSISGGKDSDIMLDMIEYIKPELTAKINYIFFDTGLEYKATKEHLLELEQKYGITIERIHAFKPIPAAVKHYGQPFLNKRISNYIHRLQQHNFKWENEPLDTLLNKYPKCRAALRWWCNDFPENRYNIGYTKYLKEFMTENPPAFQISDLCCEYAKKKTAKQAIIKTGAELSVIGLRKAEGGARNNLKNCWNKEKGVFYPLLWFTSKEISEYENARNVIHSKCYTEYKLKRTGCAGCPFGQNFEYELLEILQNEPKLYKAVSNVFHNSFEYTRKFKEYRTTRKAIDNFIENTF